MRNLKACLARQKMKYNMALKAYAEADAACGTWELGDDLQVLETLHRIRDAAQDRLEEKGHKLEAARYMAEGMA